MTTPQVRELAPVETFTSEEAVFLKRFVSNIHLPVFALLNLPEVVKGALFARYSRTDKSLRRLLLDEFRGDLTESQSSDFGGQSRAEALYDRVFGDYGDDSIAQLGSVHVACEGVSNVATKLLERGRLMSYLEQSTRYVPYTDRPGGRWKYHTPTAFDPVLRDEYRRTTDAAFETYAAFIPRLIPFLAQRLSDGTPETRGGAFGRAIRAKALDTLRGLLPAATRSNVGVYGSGQSYEMLLMRLRASGNSEAQSIGDLMFTELQKVIPSFVARVDRPDRGVAWIRYLEDSHRAVKAQIELHTAGINADGVPEVTLVDFDPDGEVKVVAAALYAQSSLPDAQLLRIARRMSVDERASVLDAYLGDRKNRRHRPGRAFERTTYRFDVLGEYGAFRDLQRHRLLTIDWQALTPAHGFVMPTVIDEAGMSDQWHQVMQRGADLYWKIVASSGQDAAYAVPMAYRIRYFMDMNAREAMHVLELRSAEQGHENYRRVARRMHSLIAEEAGHRAIARAMYFVSSREGELERLSAERAKDASRGS